MTRGWRGWLALLALLALSLPATAYAQGGSGGFITYWFGTALVPKDVASVRSTGKNEYWFTGNALPSRLAWLKSDVTIPGTEIVVAEGTLLGMARSSKLIGCTQTAPMKFRLGRSLICFIDMDDDGVLDSWFRRAGRLTFYPFSSRVSLDDIHPVDAVTISPIAEKEFADLPMWDQFWVRIVSGELTLCILPNSCLEHGVRAKPSPQVQQVDYMGGVFDYYLSADKKLNVRVKKPPTITYLGE